MHILVNGSVKLLRPEMEAGKGANHKRPPILVLNLRLKKIRVRGRADELEYDYDFGTRTTKRPQGRATELLSAPER
jgi:hypothetical protein